MDSIKMKKINVLVVKDEDGVLRPMAGIWIDNEAGKMGAENFLSKPMNDGLEVVSAELTETTNEL